ncbi:hypothetical protein PoB_005162000 [Plakobranchus ocellatus]|uniref:Uncharacterized protein n=1 Tax=Plakobranchus ocellatus TaxID=259542 RepID=A0AAV4C0J1_9GAST|nr:hypothetical protein PoB_005162000 [Plakobranchus ocellatus]
MGRVNYNFKNRFSNTKDFDGSSDEGKHTIVGLYISRVESGRVDRAGFDDFSVPFTGAEGGLYTVGSEPSAFLKVVPVCTLCSE